MPPRLIRLQGVAFVKIRSAAYDWLDSCTDTRLKKEVKKAVNLLYKNKELGVKIPKKLWPRSYRKELGVNNVYRCELCDGWRMTYTLVAEANTIGALILEILSHKDYAKRFGYRVS